MLVEHSEMEESVPTALERLGQRRVAQLGGGEGKMRWPTLFLTFSYPLKSYA